MATGPDPQPLLDKADVILVIDALAPWAPDSAEPPEAAQVIQLGPDPLHSRFAMRNFRADISLAGEVSPSIRALKQAMEAWRADRATRNAERADQVAQRNARDLAARERAALAGREGPQLTKAWVSLALSRAIRGTGAAVFSELGCQLPAMRLDHHKAWFDGPHSGGLGWGLPAAPGLQAGRSAGR